MDSATCWRCLIALGQGAREYLPEEPRLDGVICRIEGLIRRTDLRPLYSRRRELFSIGYDQDAGQLSGSHYDFLMSEARLTSYIAVSQKVAGRRHWGAMNRSMSRLGRMPDRSPGPAPCLNFYAAPALRPIKLTAQGGAGLRLLTAKRRRVRGMGLPWGQRKRLLRL